MRAAAALLGITLCTLAACTDAPTVVRSGGSTPEPALTAGVNASNYVTSSSRWNRKSIEYFRLRNSNAGRINAYLSLAQYRAVLAAKNARHGNTRPSLAGAAAGASVVVLSAYYPLDVADIDAELAKQRAEPPLDEERNLDFGEGESIGRSIGAAVLQFALGDNFGATDPGAPPVGTGYWYSSGAPIVRGGFGARPFFLTSQSELRAPPPPAFGSAAYLAGLAEVRAISDTRTPEQLAIARKWAPFSGVLFNGMATDLIDRYHRSELEAARILAYENTAAFDAIIACFDTKFAYWFIRPPQVDPLITTPVGLPNHPSYPSAHSCETGAHAGVLDEAFPSERASIDSVAQEASISRVYAGIHYRFDGEAGLTIGRSAARLALKRRGIE